jgi:diguanylate cyclase (GGDEF)-like protein/PAS domain S-box-containing protein
MSATARLEAFVAASLSGAEPAAGRKDVFLASLGIALDLVVAGEPLQPALDKVAAALCAHYNAGACLIVVEDERQPSGWARSSTARDDRFQPLVSMQEGSGSALQRAMSETRLQAIDDLTAEDDLPHALSALGLGLRSVVCMPVLADLRMKSIGAVALYFREPGRASLLSEQAIRDVASFVGSLRRGYRAVGNARQVDDRLRALASTIPGVIYQRVVKPDGDIRYSYISESAGELFGVSAQEILENPEALFSHFGPEYRATFREKLLKASRDLTLWDVEAQINRPDGQIRHTHAIARPRREADGSVVWTGVILDATRIKEAEMGAAASEATTRKAIVESIPQGLLLYGKDDRLVICNSHFCELFPGLSDVAQPGAHYEDMLRAEHDPGLNPDIDLINADEELARRLKEHGGRHVVRERQMSGDRFILINEYRTAEGGTVVLYNDISELKLRERKIEHLAHHDSLTGLPNRILFRDRLERAIAEAHERNLSAAVLCLDLDGFKHVNDTLGHPVGDALLQAVAKRLQNVLRDHDIACRLGGDEFAVILPDVSNAEVPTSLAWRLLDALSQPVDINGHSVVTGTSIGIALSATDGKNADELIRNADLALYRAKSDGRGTFRYFAAEMDAKAQARRLLEISLRGAIARQELDVHYQPLVDTYTSQIMGAEALIRWSHPEKGEIPPTEFVPLAEETGLIVSIGAWVLRRACADAAKWPADIRVAVNVSPVQFRSRNFAQTVRQVLESTGLAPHRLELEITESLLMRNTAANLAALRELKSFGVRISMDDFGTGYSSLGNLRSFPFDKIKIDRSFINDFGRNTDAAAIVRAVLTLGRSLGMTTTAEGVETRDQLAYLRAEGCVEVQGHYYARAAPALEMERLIARSPARVISPGDEAPVYFSEPGDERARAAS